MHENSSTLKSFLNDLVQGFSIDSLSNSFRNFQNLSLLNNLQSKIKVEPIDSLSSSLVISTTFFLTKKKRNFLYFTFIKFFPCSFLKALSSLFRSPTQTFNDIRHNFIIICMLHEFLQITFLLN
jgi:hypothetical protein